MTNNLLPRWARAIVVCGSTAWSGSRLLDQSVAQELSSRVPVLYVEPPLSIASARRDVLSQQVWQQPRLRQIDDRLALLTPHVPPFKERPGMKAVSLALTRRAIAGAVRQLGTDVVDAVVIPSLNPLFGVVNERTKLFYAKDDFVAGAELMRIDASRLIRAERRQREAADLIVAVSPVLAARYEAMGFRVALVPNGCDPAKFRRPAPPPVQLALPGPVIGFFGHLSDRIDLAMLEAVADRGQSLLLVGPRQATATPGRLDALLARPNVQWLGPKPFEELAQYLWSVDVAVLPYLDSEFNRASFPLKLLEYLAAGRRVVATDLPAVQWLDTPLIAAITTPRQFADAVDVATASTPTEQEISARIAFASAHSWNDRARQLSNLLGLESPSLHSERRQ